MPAKWCEMNWMHSQCGEWRLLRKTSSLSKHHSPHLESGVKEQRKTVAEEVLF